MLPEVKDGPALLRVPSEERPSPFREWLQAQSWPSYPTEMRYTSEYETSELRAIVAGHWYGIIQKALIWVGGANEISARNSMGKAPGIVGKKVVNDMIGFCALNTAFSCDLHDISQSNTPDEVRFTVSHASVYYQNKKIAYSTQPQATTLPNPPPPLSREHRFYEARVGVRAMCLSRYSKSKGDLNSVEGALREWRRSRTCWLLWERSIRLPFGVATTVPKGVDS
jgi:hypothetical protein